MRDGHSFEMCVPSKLFEVMGSGVPVVLAADGEASRIVHDTDAGLVGRAGDAAGLARSIRRLHADGALARKLGRNGRAATEERYDRQRIAATVAAALEETLAGARRASGRVG